MQAELNAHDLREVRLGPAMLAASRSMRRSAATSLAENYVGLGRG
jgi:hypothetical protein